MSVRSDLVEICEEGKVKNSHLKLKFFQVLGLGVVFVVLGSCGQKPSKTNASTSKGIAKTRGTKSLPMKTQAEKGTAKPNPVQKTAGTCTPDTRGQRMDEKLRDQLGDKLEHIWARESALITRAEWQPFMPTGDGSSELKLVSFEISNAAAAGHYLPDFKCVRLRFLSKEKPKMLSKTLERGWRLKPSQRQSLLTGQMNNGAKLDVHIGLNQDLLTQVDVAAVPKGKIPIDMPLSKHHGLFNEFRAKNLVGFEYGIYASARPGLKFPGLERAILLIDESAEEAAHALEDSGFLKQERGEDLYQKDFETYTFRSYAKTHLSLFWQLRLTKDALKSHLIGATKSEKPGKN